MFRIALGPELKYVPVLGCNDVVCKLKSLRHLITTTIPLLIVRTFIRGARDLCHTCPESEKSRIENQVRFHRQP